MSKIPGLLPFQDRLLYVTDREPVIMARGSGLYLWDTEGKRYVDFLGGWAVNSLGHAPRVIHDVLCKQSKLLLNASPSFLNQPMLELAHRLTEISCFDRVFFCSTGAEANESAIKLARKYGTTRRDGAFEIIATERGFHGRTLATMAATGKEAWRTLFEPKAGGFRHVPFNDADAMERATTDDTVAIIVEPVQGEGGVNPATKEYLQALRALCDKRGLLLIFDEIQTGIGRTGTMFAYEQFGVEPDIMTLGKGLGGGFPVAAMLCKEELNIFEKGEQGGTFTGQPLAMAVALAVVDYVMEKRLFENARNKGDEIRKILHSLSETFPLGGIRGRGLLLAFDLEEPVAERLRSVCFRNGLIFNAPGAHTVRLVPPLIVESEQIQEMEDILRTSLQEVFEK